MPSPAIPPISVEKLSIFITGIDPFNRILHFALRVPLPLPG
jgi:hypothetical protein